MWKVEYKAREKALKDYNTQMSSSLARGLKRGEEIAEACGTSVEIVKEILL